MSAFVFNIVEPNTLVSIVVAALLCSIGCGVPDIDLSKKNCPCVDGWICNTATNICVIDEKCERRQSPTLSDSKSNRWTEVWYCRNTPGELFEQPNPDAPIALLQNTQNNWFVCYSLGADSSDNNIWYYAFGEPLDGGSPSWGFLPSSNLATQIHPYPGIPKCPENLGGN